MKTILYVSVSVLAVFSLACSTSKSNAGALLPEQSAHWTACEARSGVSAVVRDTKLLAGKLTEGSKYAVEEVGKGNDDLGKAVSDLGRKA